MWQALIIIPVTMIEFMVIIWGGMVLLDKWDRRHDKN